MSLQTELLETSFQKVKPHANEFGVSFYENLFSKYPEAKPLFATTDLAEQQKKLMASLVLVVENIRKPEVLESALKGLGAKHVKYGALPEHYPLVGNALLTTFEQYLGSDWTPEVKQAWVDAYGAITELMLSGADYSPEIVNLETAPATPTTTTASPVELVESSFEKIKPQANEFVASFYENLFSASPEAKPLFNTTNMAEQKKKLLASLVLVVENIRKPEVLESALKGLGAKHVKYGALPEHYPLVGNALLTTFEQYLGSDWTPEVKQAWVDAYGAITELMLSGADYSPEIVQLETTPAATTTTTASPVELVESSFEKIKPQANEFVASFYENLFTASPEAKPLFNTTNMAEQKKKLLASLVLVVENIRKPEVLESALKGLGAKHVKYGALPEHYPLVGNALLTTFEQYLGSDWTPEVKQAWVDAYGSITELMLSGADYSPEIVKLETAPKTPTAAPVKPTTQPVYSASTPVYQEEEINWGLFGGIFAGAGLLTIILLLLL